MARPRSLLALEHLSPAEITSIFALARKMQAKRPGPLLAGKRIALLFYEASTRTRVSFEFAAKQLGTHTTVISAAASSIEKGESLVDTGKTLQALGADCIVMRHPSSGAPNVLARNLRVPIINAGDGMHEHPSQGLLDAYTILRHKKTLKGLKVAMIGDIQHSRVARSNIHLLSKFGADVTLCGPSEFLPEVALTLAPGLRLTRHLEEAVQKADVVMMLRVQKERLVGLNIDTQKYIAHYQLTAELLKLAKKDAIVMHPGPMVRGMEIQSELAESPQAAIEEQVHNGVFVRMAVLAICTGVA
ncbi:MAG TPA: aspartate carbamoyltransferase catalytic subunit [Candidatus Saccharimonadales bacterium]|jgi:aspartate carbamoyltransferase catalytic subunit|nr:aspartate carbamoyltransferase catalytic subunit [Candidatus Saccharimonadales bacterium]